MKALREYLGGCAFSGLVALVVGIATSDDTLIGYGFGVVWITVPPLVALRRVERTRRMTIFITNAPENASEREAA